MAEKNPMHVHKKRENPLTIEAKGKISEKKSHDFLNVKKTLKSHGFNMLLIHKDVTQALKSLQPDVPFSRIIEEALLKYLEALSPNEYKNLVRLLKERG